MATFRGALGNPQKERESMKAWLGSIKELLDHETLTEILVYIYTKNFPDEEATLLLTKQEIPITTEEPESRGNVRFL